MLRHNFNLTSAFLDSYKSKVPAWGPIGHFVYKTHYARPIESEGRLEEWWETVKRVVEGTYSIQRWHCEQLKLPWNQNKAQHSAQIMYDLIFNFKFLPPGRGLWMMGTDYVYQRGAAALNNCAFKTTANIKLDFAEPFAFLMDMSMLGVGVGIDTDGAGTIIVKQPKQISATLVVEDSREGWVSLMATILDAYTGYGGHPAQIDFSKVRPYGAPIKSFGGTASGPAPLKQLVADLLDILNPLIGSPITERAIVDIANAIGACVVSGNVRRSAEIVLGDPQSDEYLSLKDPTINQARIDKFGWASNNSVVAKVGMDYSKCVNALIKNGEPGFFWRENAQAFGRMCDPPNFKDRRAKGCNPCVTEDTWVHTTTGPKQVKELVGKQATLLVEGHPYHTTSQGFFLTQKKAQVYSLNTAEGFSLRLTPNHLVLTKHPDIGLVWKEARHLQYNDQIVISNQRSANIQWTNPSINTSWEEGYLIGLLIGDGTIVNGKAILSVWGHNLGYQGILDTVLSCVEEMPKRSDFNGWGYIEDRKEYRLSLAAINALLDKYHIDKNKMISITMEEASSDFYRGFLRGFFDADGSVQGTQTKGISVRLGQSDLSRLQAAQRMLLRLGIYSKIFLRKEPGYSVLPDGHGGSKEYPTKTAYDLIISKESLRYFNELIGFSDTHKQGLLNAKLSAYQRELNKDLFTATFTELVQDNCEDVYDVTVENIHAFDANGFFVHNCSEQTLEDDELCTLVETFPAHHDSYHEYERTLKYAYLYAKTVTLLPTHNQRTNAVMMRNRRIGTSQSGIAQSINKIGFAEHMRWSDQGYKYIQDLDEVYSDWLSVRESIKTTSVKPSGTVSLLCGATPGIHYPFSEYYYRTIRLDNGSEFLRIAAESGYRCEATDDGTSSVVYFPVRERHFERASSEVTLWEQMELASQMQYWWADNQVSVTITFQPHEIKDLKKVLSMYDRKLKGVSFLAYPSYERMLEMGYKWPAFIPISKEEYDTTMAQVRPMNLSSTLSTQGDEKQFCDGDACLLRDNK